jgi:hypothetical protein
MHGLQSTEHKAQRWARTSGLEPLSCRREAGKHVLYYDGSLKEFAVRTARAELLSLGNGTLLSTIAAGILGAKKYWAVAKKRTKRYNV